MITGVALAIDSVGLPGGAVVVGVFQSPIAVSDVGMVPSVKRDSAVLSVRKHVVVDGVGMPERAVLVSILHAIGVPVVVTKMRVAHCVQGQRQDEVVSAVCHCGYGVELPTAAVVGRVLEL